MPISRRALLGSALGGAGLLVAPPGFAQTATWPKRPVRIIVPFAAGVAADVLTRILADQLHTRLHQPFIVENRTGAGGNIAMSVAAKANPDGYTIVSGTVGTFSINQFLYPQMSFDPERDFALVSLIWEAPNGVFVSAEHNPAKTLSEFIAWAKERPKGITFGSSGIGTTPHLAGELFRERAGISATHVPFRDAGQRLTQLLSGSIDFNIDNVASYASLLKAGQVRGLLGVAEVGRDDDGAG